MTTRVEESGYNRPNKTSKYVETGKDCSVAQGWQKSGLSARITVSEPDSDTTKIDLSAFPRASTSRTIIVLDNSGNPVAEIGIGKGAGTVNLKGDGSSLEIEYQSKFDIHRRKIRIARM